ncbi:MAG: MBL fold metallo-hydrolase [Pirellulaceae bacterium]
MSITYQVLGEPGRDNAVFATVNTGHSQHRLLFDCGEGCLDAVPRADVQAIEGLFFSHFHIDHIAGFDRFFRANWFRAEPPVRIFGPAGARSVLHHRLQGYTWNLVENLTGEVRVCELVDESLRTSRYLAPEGFAVEHRFSEAPFDGVVYANDAFRVEARVMHHGVPCLAYLVREADRSNVDSASLTRAGLPEGPWLQRLKDRLVPDEAEIEISGAMHLVGELRKQLLTRQAGDSLAYLTDFRVRNEQEEDELVDFLEGCGVLICEDTFRDDDLDLARQSHHLTSSDVGRLASRVAPEQLIVFHVSDRYTEAELRGQLAQVRRRFERAAFPPHWRLSAP